MDNEIEELAELLIKLMYPNGFRGYHADSIKECVNTCNGIADKLIKANYHRTTSSVELVEASKSVLTWFKSRSEGFQQRCSKAIFNQLEEALAKFKGDGK